MVVIVRNRKMTDDLHRKRVVNLMIAVLMVVTGSLNTIAAKWADSIKVDNTTFNHPFFQAICMFIGEFCCLIAFFIIYVVQKVSWRRRNIEGEGGIVAELDGDVEPTIPKFNVFIFLPPAICDIMGTSLMYIGLNLTSASSYQMLRGMSIVTAGLVVVGVSDIVFDDRPTDDTNGIITGNLLIIMAQIIVAIQMVTEQKYLTQYDVPALLAVGLEGLFGMIILSVLLIPMYYIHVPSTFSSNPYGRLEDIFFAFKEIGDNPTILAALALTIVSIAFFNFAGVTVTKRLSATSRMVLDSVRTLVIWIISIPLFGEQFIAIQLLGFALLLVGMFVYNDLIFGPVFRQKVLPKIENNSLSLCCASFCGADIEVADRESLLDDDDVEHMAH
uniref:Solute carrier family 35 member F6 n=1 Tax=Panagrolaimus superbus TaxID=310955 RepID=A0A914YL94_9BILA